MAAGYPGRDLGAPFGYGAGSTFQYPYQQRSDGRGGNILKRSLAEFDRQQIYLRSIKQRTSPMSPLSPIDLSSSSSSSSAISTNSSSPGFNFNFLRGQHQQHPKQLPPSDFSFITPPPAPEFEKKIVIKNQLEELERQLLLDDDDVNCISASGSVMMSSTTNDWSETMQQLISPSPPPPPPSPPLNPVSSSPTTSSCSSSSSKASCSPTPSTPSKQLLLETATAISEGNLETAAANLALLKKTANKKGDPDQRLTEMIVPALEFRLNPPPATVTRNSPIAELCTMEHQTATHLLYDASPCFRLALIAANYAILDAVRDDQTAKLHIVDFDLGQGGQYVSLINAVAERSRHRPSAPVKITAVCDPTFPFNTVSSANNLRNIGDKITRLAERFGVVVRFNVLNRRTTELDRTSLGCEPGETLAVNLAFLLSRIADESVSLANPRDELLRRVKSLEPNVVTVVEHEMNANTAPFGARFSEACGYFGSILDSLDATASRENQDRIRVESCLARKAMNLIAREGADRVERPEVLGKWRARFSMAGFKAVPFGPAVSESVKCRFGSVKTNPGFTYKEEAGGFGFGWMGRVLTVASSWH